MKNNYTIPEMLENSFKTFSGRIALSINSTNYHYHDIKEKVYSLSTFLKEEGIIKGDRIAILGENHPNWGITYLSITNIGAIAVPIMFDFSPTEIEYILKHSKAKMIFVSSKYLSKLEEGSFPDLKFFILLDDFSVIDFSKEEFFISKLYKEGKTELEKIKTSALKFVGLIKENVEEDDIASIIYTSGTTGHSKGVILTHKNLLSNAASIGKKVNITENDKFLSILPLSHTMECTLGFLAPLMFGASVYYLDKPPTASALLPALKIVQPTIMLSVPLVIEKIFKTKIYPLFTKNFFVKMLYKLPNVRKKLHKVAGHKLADTFGGKLRMFCIGGAPLMQEVERFLKEARFPYSVGFGLTETSPLVTGNPPETFRYRSVGQVLPDVQIKIDKPDFTTGEGEILVKGA